jgi:hypothetical protein
VIEEQSQATKVVYEETKEVSIKLSITETDVKSLHEDYDSFDSPSDGIDDDSKKSVALMPISKEASFANLQNLSKKRQEVKTDHQMINESYYIRMQLASLEGGANSSVAFEAKMKDGDLQAFSNAIIMEVNFMAAQLFELFMLMNELVN